MATYLGAARNVQLRWSLDCSYVYVWAFVRDRTGGGWFFRTGRIDA